jgi:hypothetical protein
MDIPVGVWYNPRAMTTGSPHVGSTSATFFGCWYAWRFS